MLDKVLYSKDYTFMDRAFCCIEHKTMIRREQIFYAAIFLLIALLLVQNFDPLLCAVVSCLYPAYETTKSLTMRSNEEYKQRKHWLIYWIVFSFVTLQDYYMEWLTKLFSPLFLLKMLFLMLLALPQTGVAELCYCDIVVPVLSIVNNAFLKYNWQSNNVTHVTANGSKENDQ
ncbi:Receptor expression-enhancing protein [Dirofilaria immitis]